MNIKRIFYLIKFLFSVYPPPTQLVMPPSFKKNKQISFVNKKYSKTIKTCFQLVRDPFYFLFPVI